MNPMAVPSRYLKVRHLGRSVPLEVAVATVAVVNLAVPAGPVLTATR
jgi:hypothetical protein